MYRRKASGACRGHTEVDSSDWVGIERGAAGIGRDIRLDLAPEMGKTRVIQVLTHGATPSLCRSRCS